MATKKPIATNSNTSWTATGAATIHEAIDDDLATTDDGTTRVASNVNGATFSVAIDTMENPNDTTAGSLVFYFRIVRSALVGDAALQDITFVLKSTGSTFATIVWPMTTFTAGWATFSYTPTQAELALITNYDDIDVVATLNITAGTTIRISCIEVFVATRTLRAYVIS